MGDATRHEATRPQQSARARAAKTTNPRSAATAALSPMVPLQKTLGNRAVERLVQAKLRTGQPGQRSDHETERMADEPIRAPEPNGSVASAHVPVVASAAMSRRGQTRALQRKCACGSGSFGLSGECEECSKKKLGLQPKLPISEPGDLHEQEADRLADQVLTTPPGVGAVPLRIHHFGSTGQLGSAPSSVRRVVAGRGRPLDAPLRQEMEQHFGHDFSGVRVHSGAAAERSAQEINAQAYTVGRDIVFGAGRFAPETRDGRRLLAHELTHVLQQADSATALQRQPDGGARSTRPVPEWALTTPVGALPGVPVPDYESPRPQYTEVDRSNMLAALNTRVQLNGQRLARFYHDLRVVWMDLILELAIDDAGLSFGAQTVASIVTNLLTAPLKAGPGLIVGIIADGIVNVTDSVLKEKKLNQRKKMLRDMMVAPTVADVGEKDANGRLANLLLDAIGYATWLQVAVLDNLWKFRIPPEFPPVPASDIRFEVAAAVLRYRSGALYESQLKAVADPYGTYIGGFKHVGNEVLQVRIRKWKETDLEWNLRTHSALFKSVMGHRIGDLADLPLIVEFLAVKDEEVYDPDVEHVGRVIIGRNTTGSIIVHSGNFIGLYELHGYCHPDEKALTKRDVYLGSMYERADAPRQVELRRRIEALRVHYRQYAECGADVLLREYIDPFYLIVRRR